METTALIRENIAAGEIRSALALLVRAAEPTAHRNAAIALNGRFAAWDFERQTGQLEGSVELNRIRVAALGLCDDLDRPAPAAGAPISSVNAILLQGKRRAQTILAEKVAFFAERLALDSNSAALFLQLRDAQKALDDATADIAALENQP